jgi:hypothetical protein
LTYKIAIVGVVIIGMTNAIVILENNRNRSNKFDVILFSKEDPLASNSDAVVAFHTIH